MNSGFIIGMLVVGGIFGLLFLARSVLRLCQGKFLSAIAVLFLAVVFFMCVALVSSWLTANARNPKVIAVTKASEKEKQTNEPQPTSAGDAETSAPEK